MAQGNVPILYPLSILVLDIGDSRSYRVCLQIQVSSAQRHSLAVRLFKQIIQVKILRHDYFAHFQVLQLLMASTFWDWLIVAIGSLSGS